MRSNLPTNIEWRADDGELLDAYLRLAPRARRDHFLGTAQAAEMAGVSRRTIQFWINSGEIRALRVGRRYQVIRSTLRSYLRRCAEATQ